MNCCLRWMPLPPAWHPPKRTSSPGKPTMGTPTASRQRVRPASIWSNCHRSASTNMEMASAARNDFDRRARLASVGEISTPTAFALKFFTAEKYFAGNKILIALAVLLGFNALYLAAAWWAKRRAQTNWWLSGAQLGLAAQIPVIGTLIAVQADKPLDGDAMTVSGRTLQEEVDRLPPPFPQHPPQLKFQPQLDPLLILHHHRH
mgnify:CR=1 FL=1